jgi:hypothetical protein
MKRIIFTLISLMTVTVYLNAQDTSLTSYGTGSTSSSFQSSGNSTASETESTSATAETGATSSYGHSATGSESAQYVSNKSSTDSQHNEKKKRTAKEDKQSILSNVQWGGTIDMQVDKEMWDEFGQDSYNRLKHSSLNLFYRRECIRTTFLPLLDDAPQG